MELLYFVLLLAGLISFIVSYLTKRIDFIAAGLAFWVAVETLQVLQRI